MKRFTFTLIAPLITALAAPGARAQQAAAPTPELAVGAVAPDFTLPGATRFGTLKAPVHLRSEEHTSELQSQSNLVCRLLLEKKKMTVRYSPDISYYRDR